MKSNRLFKTGSLYLIVLVGPTCHNDYLFHLWFRSGLSAMARPVCRKPTHAPATTLIPYVCTTGGEILHHLEDAAPAALDPRLPAGRERWRIVANTIPWARRLPTGQVRFRRSGHRPWGGTGRQHGSRTAA
jgi:hypothetical protein